MRNLYNLPPPRLQIYSPTYSIPNDLQFSISSRLIVMHITFAWQMVFIVLRALELFYTFRWFGFHVLRALLLIILFFFMLLGSFLYSLKIDLDLLEFQILVFLGGGCKCRKELVDQGCRCLFARNSFDMKQFEKGEILAADGLWTMNKLTWHLLFHL